MSATVSCTDSYFTLLGNLSSMNEISLLSYFFLTIMRIIPSMVLAPFFGAKTLPAPIRIMFSISITVIILPFALIHSTRLLSFDLVFVGLALKEWLLGFIIAFLITIPFYVAQAAGNFIEHIRGSSSLQVTDPTTSSQTTPIGMLYNYVLIFIFFSIGGPILYIEALAQSFMFIPITELFNTNFFLLEMPFWKKMISVVHYVVSLALQLGAPSIIGVLMVEMFLGIANRLAPQVQIVFLGMPLKSWVGLAMLALAWFFITKELSKESLNWIQEINKLLIKTNQLNLK